MTREERLAEAIRQHPQLWQAMGDAWKLHRSRPDLTWADGQHVGFLRALCIVGGFDTCVVERKLKEDFGG